MPDLTIRNARIFLPDGLLEGGLTVEGGKIKRISRGELPKSNRDIDAGKRLVIPGVIDAHVHFHDPNFSHREDFESGSKAAAAGGVTSVISMPLDTPILAPQEIRDAIEAGESESIIDFSLHAGNMKGGAEKYIPEDIELGVKTFKIFTCLPDFLPRKIRGRLMVAINDAGGLSFVHAEDNEIVQKRTKELKEGGRNDPLAHAESRPNKAEKRAVSKVVSDARESGCGVHFAHITARQSVDILREAKENGENITAETCPQYLLFTREDFEKKGAYLRMNPPPRTKADVAKLWEALERGVIDMVTTDHAPGTREEKKAGTGNIWDAQLGIPGVETLLPLLFSEGFEKGRLPLGRLVDALSTSPAKRFGLYPRKGTIEEGTDADLVIVDREKTVDIGEDWIHYKVGWTPYQGMSVTGLPVITISRDEIIFRDGAITGSPGRGEFIRATK